MIKLLTLICLSLCAFSLQSAQAASRFEIKQMVMREAINQDVPVSLALAVAKVESDFNAKALSSAGARGVMQIMPKTASGEFGIPAKKLWHPETNIRLGISFLKQLHEQYDGRWEFALSHYNGGTIHDNRPHKYTKKYVQTVQRWQKIYMEQASLWEDIPQNDLFDDEDDYETADLREWKMRGRDDQEEIDEWAYWEDDETDRRNNTRIVIVERGTGYEDHRPPPPHWGPPPRHRGHRPPPPRQNRGFY